MTSIPLLPKARKLWFQDDMLFVSLNDGRQVGVPMAWFPDLQSANENVQTDWRFLGEGLAIRWESLDLEIPIDRFLR